MAATPPTIYSVPRKLDIASLLMMTTGYALLFALMNRLDFGFETFSIVAGLITLVGIAQAVLFGGRAPRAASILTGLAYCVTVSVCVQNPFRKSFAFDDFLRACIPGIFFGSIWGYLAGTCVGGVFLVSHHLRTAIERRQGIHQAHPQTPDEPFDALR
jgi:hypothetical protein